MFIIALFIIGKKMKTIQYSSTKGWKTELQYIYTMELLLSIKRNEQPIQAMKWANPS